MNQTRIFLWVYWKKIVDYPYILENIKLVSTWWNREWFKRFKCWYDKFKSRKHFRLQKKPNSIFKINNQNLYLESQDRFTCSFYQRNWTYFQFFFLKLRINLHKKWLISDKKLVISKANNLQRRKIHFLNIWISKIFFPQFLLIICIIIIVEI